ncbi:DNA-3-methyladenine glycosylase 2 [Klebsiella pneumoniae]|nr:DNA-3-methyladenine glycosylase 2 [Klebsiella pneumoniae]HBY9737795.1 hypothetical protein [Klebsiella pneumoniae]HBY9803296.1 hypothetical protein [Klebsiella pneumoniae]
MDTFVERYDNPSWNAFLEYKRKRLIKGVEEISRGVYVKNVKNKRFNGLINVRQLDSEYIDIRYCHKGCEDITGYHNSFVNNILDVRANMNDIYKQLGEILNIKSIHQGVRVFGNESIFEALVVAICSQQLSVRSAFSIISDLVSKVNSRNCYGLLCFPEPMSINNQVLQIFKLSKNKKEALSEIIKTFSIGVPPELSDLIRIKGIGRWTVDYVKIFGLHDCNIWLCSDRACSEFSRKNNALELGCEFPCASYLTMQVMYGGSI